MPQEKPPADGETNAKPQLRGGVLILERREGSFIIANGGVRSLVVKRMTQRTDEPQRIAPPEQCVFVLQSPDDPKKRINAIAVHVHEEIVEKLGAVIFLDSAEGMDGKSITLSLAFIPPKPPAGAETVNAKLVDTANDLPDAPSAFEQEAKLLEQLVRGRLISSIIEGDIAAKIVGDSLLKNHLPEADKTSYTTSKLPIEKQIPLFAKIPGESCACAALRKILLTAPVNKKEWMLRKVVIAYCQEIVDRDLAKRAKENNPLEGVVGVWLKEIMTHMPVVDDEMFEQEAQEGAAAASSGMSKFSFQQALSLLQGKSPAGKEKGLSIASELCSQRGMGDALAKNDNESEAFDKVRKEILAAAADQQQKTGDAKLRVLIRDQGGCGKLMEGLTGVAKKRDELTGKGDENQQGKGGGSKGAPPKK